MEKGVTLALVSDGAKGCYYGFGNQINYMPSFTAAEVDATGAGDALTAGVISKLIEVYQIRYLQLSETSIEVISEIVRYGCACGAIAVSALGCISQLSKDKVNRLLGEKYDCKE
jgi:sugar/nucleoside kinase (ribokinase family)